MILLILLLVVLCGTISAIQGQGNWTAVEPDYILTDLETTPLEIKTNSTIGSEDEVNVIFSNSQGDWAGGVRIYLSSTPQYYLSNCISNTNFPSTLPTAVDKVWRISLTRTSDITLQIHCNDVEVVNFLMDDTCSNSDWRKYWSRDVEKIVFTHYDTASDYYRFIPGDWKIVKLDLETAPLEIKTNSTIGSEDEVNVIFYNSQGYWAGGVRIYFSSTPQHLVSRCSTSSTHFPSTLPTAVDKVWRISLTRTSGITLQIHCNDVEVLNFLLSDDTCSYSNWRNYWSTDIKKIGFTKYDTASDYYRFIPGDWKTLNPAIDLETTLLEIKTNSTQGSGDEIGVYFYTSSGEKAGRVWIYFSSVPQFRLDWCISWTNFPSTLPTAVDKVWRISLNKTSGVRLYMKIHCNDIEVLNFLVSKDRCDDSNWRNYWSRDVEKIGFSIDDTASDYYRPFIPGICTGLKPAWTDSITTTTQFPVDPGTVVEVACSNPNTFYGGSSQVTCAAGTQFTYRIEPYCRALGN